MTLALRLFLLLVLAAACAGCALPRLAGTSDVELIYEAPSDPEPARFGEDLRALVLRRLSAAKIGADVEQEGRRVRVVVDEVHTEVVDERVTWSGTLLLFEVADDAVAGAPREGSRAEILATAAQIDTPPAHRILVEPVWATTRGSEEPRYRTRLVKRAPLGELGDDVMVGAGDDGALRLRVAPGSQSGAALAAGRALRGAGPRTVLARGRLSLGAAELGDNSAFVGFGGGLPSYARSLDERRILTTPRLPVLRRMSSVGLPPNTWLATSCFVLPILLSLGWLAFVRRFDRAHPEPIWLVLTTFALGAASVVPAAALESAAVRLTPWLDPRLVSFGGRLSALPLAFVVFAIVVGLVEEGAKLAAAGFATRRREFDEPVDGIVYGIVASLGFAAAENIHYFAVARLSAPIVIARCFMSVPAHMFFGAVWGYALGARLVDRGTRLWIWVAAAAAAHGLFDALLMTEGAAGLALLLNVGLASAFVALVRRALRHGVVVDAMREIRADDRRLFRVGRPAHFAGAALAVHALALGVFLLGAWYQMARHRPSLTFVGGSSVMLALLGVAALGVSSTVPLDVAVDDYGVTFAGAARPWNRIRGFSAERDYILLECEGGPIRLGPGRPDVLEALGHALAEHLGGGGRPRAVTLESAPSSPT